MGNIDEVIGVFDAATEEPAKDMEWKPLPSGEYCVVIVVSEIAETKAQTGKRLKLTMEVVEGDHKGRKIFDGINIVNRNEKAQGIGRATLSSICRAINVMSPKDTAELHDRPLMVKVSTEPGMDGQPRNVVKHYYATAKQVVKAPAKAVKTPPVPNDDDIPF